MPVLSVTYRPDELKLSIEEYYKLICHKSITNYYIGCESADEESKDINHYQCYVISTQSCTNFRKRVKSALAIENVHALKVEVHNDPEYLLGYCQKEGKGYLTNIDQKELIKALKYYNNKKEVIEQSRDAKSVGFTVDQIVENVLQMHLKNKEETYVHAYFIEFMRKYRSQIKYHVYSKINQTNMKKYIEIYVCEDQLIDQENNFLT